MYVRLLSTLQFYVLLTKNMMAAFVCNGRVVLDALIPSTRQLLGKFILGECECIPNY